MRVNFILIFTDKTSHMRVLSCLVLLLLYGCGINFKPTSSGGIAGKILPLSGIVFNHSEQSFFNSAYAMATCDSDVYARLFYIQNDGSLEAVPKVSNKVKNNRYEFKASELPLDIYDSNIRYQVQIEGCDQVFSRPVTDINDLQDVTWSSTLLGLAVQSTLTKPLSSVDRSALNELMDKIAGSSLSDAYNNLDSSPALTTKFQTIFLDAPQRIAEASPSTIVVAFPTMINEGLASTFKVSGFHFKNDYDIAYEWHIDGVLSSNSAQWVYSPGADGAGTFIITSIMGQNDGTGNVDRSFPFVTTSRSVAVLNTLPAVAPDISLATTHSNSATVTVKVATGTNSENCDSFKFFLLTESGTTPLPSNPGFNRQCSIDVEQNESFTTTAGNGLKTIRIWAKDNNGLISSVKDLSFILDTLPPVVNLTSPSGLYSGGTTLNLSLSSSDLNFGTFKLQYSQDGVTFSDVANLSASTTNYNWTLPSHNTTAAEIRIIATDLAGNSSQATSTPFTIDSSAPTAPAVTLASANPNSSTAILMTAASCTDRTKLFFSESAVAPLVSAVGWQDCSTVPAAMTFTVSGTDAVKTIYAWARDSAGNVSSSSSLNMTLDTTAPLITLSALNGGQFVKGGASENITYSASDVNLATTPISLSYSCDGGSSWSALATTANSGSYAWTTPNNVDSTNCKVKVVAIDQAGHSTTVISTAAFTIDSTPPSLTASAMIINGGDTSTASNYVKVSLSGSDTISKITHFCLKYNSTSGPLAGDGCWIAVNAPSPGLTPAATLNLSEFDFLMGFGSGVYSVYAWLKDEAGNISTLTNSGSGTLSQDKTNITYTPGTPPIVVNVGAYSNDAPNSPAIPSDLYVASGGDVYIKWSATDDMALSGTPVSLHYTTDDINYYPIASNIQNAGNGGCTVTAGTTGCYVWNQSVTSSYLKIRVAVTDANAMTSFSATSINSSPLNFLAGNTDTGLGGSAASALFFNESSSTITADPGSLVIANNGTIYFRDINRGILSISPTDGVVKLLIPTTNASTGDGGNIASATVKVPVRIALDYQDRLLIYDYDRIRRVNTNATPMTISTIIGGGASSADGVSPLNVSFTTPGSYAANNTRAMAFFPLPNGDIYFQSENFLTAAPNFRVRVFHAATNTVDSIYPNGVGAFDYPSDDLTAANSRSFAVVFDPTNSTIQHMQTNLTHVVSGDTYYPAVNLDLTTHAATSPHPPYLGDKYAVGYHQGRDGQLYRTSRHQARLYRYDLPTNTAVILAGTGTRGTCIDGTVATLCNMDPQDIFVNQSGQVYFMDRGRIRTISADNTILTLYGQSSSFGDGETPQSARFGLLTDLGVRNSGEIIVLDSSEVRIREFNIGGTINSIAGNGTSASSMSTTVDAAGLAIRPVSRMVVNPANGDVFELSSSIAKLNRATGRWVNVVGGGGTNYSAGDGLSGSSINLNNMNGYVPFGFDGTNLLSLIWRWFTGTGTQDYFYKLHDNVSGTQSHLAGVTGATPGFCANGVALASCGVSSSSAPLSSYDAANNRWFIGLSGNAAIKTMIPGGTMTNLVTLPSAIRALVYRKLANNDEILYYCSATDGKIHKYNLTTSSNTVLAWPTTTVSCQAHNMVYSATRNSLIFIYKQNGLSGVAEYMNP